MLAAPCPDPMAVATGPDPYTAYAHLRERAGVHWLAERQLWAVVSAAAVDAALQLPAARVRPPAEPVPAFLVGTRAGQVFAALARMTDGPAHARQRARTLALMQRLTADRLAAAVAQSAPAHVSPNPNAWPAQRDAATLNAWIRALPTRTVAAALGFTAHQPAAIAEWTGAWVTGLSPLATDAQRLAAISAMDALLALLADAGICSMDDAAAHVALWMQPHEATAGLIGAGLLRLAQDAPLRHAALAGTLPWDRFGAEVLRHDPPIQNTRRTLASDATLDGQALRAGDTLLLVLASAARDPAANDAPDTFRLDRPARTPLALGAGTHACPGGAAALAIAAGCWRHVAQQWDDAGLARLARGVRWQPSVNARIPVFATSC